MKASSHSLDGSRRTASKVRHRIERGGERLWRYQDFAGLPFTSVAQALSRLTRAGFLERLSKGIYYRGRQTSFGPSRPNPATIQKLASQQNVIFPAGLAAANLLGFTTQNPKDGEIATTALSLPRKLIGPDTIIHTRRPMAWTGLCDTDAALLDFLRQGGKSSELSPDGTIRKVLVLVSEKDCFDHLLKVAHSEPPRVRAMLGAIGEEIGKSPRALNRIKATLNPLSQFDFGMFSGLRYALNWQAKERPGHETI